MLPDFRIKVSRICHNPYFDLLSNLKWIPYELPKSNLNYLSFYIVAMVVIGLIAYRATSNFSDYILGADV